MIDLHRVAQIAALTLLAVCTACTATASPSPTTTVPSPGAPSDAAPAQPAAGARELVWPDGSIVESVEIDATLARPAGEDDYRLLEVSIQQWEGQDVLPLSLGPDGRTLVTVIPPDNYDESTGFLKSPAVVGMLDGQQFEPFDSTVDAIAGDPPRQTAGGGMIANGHAVWLETASTNLFTSDWRIFTKDLTRPASPVLVAKAEDVYPPGELPLAVGEHRPILSGDRVYWQTTYQRENGSFRTKIVSTPLAGGDLRTEVDLASEPAAFEGGIVAAQMHDVTVEGAQSSWQIQDPRRASGLTLVDADGRSRPFVSFSNVTDDEWFVRELAAGGTTVALSIGDSIYILGTDRERAVRVRMSSNTEASGVAVCGDRVTWTDISSGDGRGEHQYMFNVSTNELVAVTTPSNPGAGTCYGDTFLWYSQSDDGGATLTTWRPAARSRGTQAHHQR